MTLRSEIRAALAEGPKTAARLVEDCDSASDAAAMANNLWALKKEGKVKIAGTVEGRNSYLIDDWPEKAAKTGERAESAPPQGGSPARASPASYARAARRCTLPAARRKRLRAIRDQRIRRARHRESRGADQARPRRVCAAAHLHRARRIDLQPHGVNP